jgi:hypothetical protein
MNPRIVEREVRIEKVNEPFAETEVGRVEIDDNIFSIDDTLKVGLQLDFSKTNRETYNDELVVVSIYVMSSSGMTQTLIYKRNMREYSISGIFRRYRVPFNMFEDAVQKKLTILDDNYFKCYDGNKTDISKSIFDGNPRIKFERHQALSVRILAPISIVKSKSKITLELMENRSHPTEKEVKVI